MKLTEKLNNILEAKEKGVVDSETGKVSSKAKKFGTRVLVDIMNAKNILRSPEKASMDNIVNTANSLFTIIADADLNGLTLSDNLTKSVRDLIQPIQDVKKMRSKE